MEDSGISIELALRGAMIAKKALELVNLAPTLARLQLAEVVREVMEADKSLAAKGFTK